MEYDVFLYTDEDGVYIARVPALRGVHSFGKTPEAAMANVREAIELALEDDEVPLHRDRRPHRRRPRMMAPRLPRLSSRKVEGLLRKRGFVMGRQKGSHGRWRRAESRPSPSGP